MSVFSPIVTTDNADYSSGPDLGLTYSAVVAVDDHTVLTVMDDSIFEGFEIVRVRIDSTNYDDVTVTPGSFTFTITDREG